MDYKEELKEKILSDIKVWWEQSQKYGAKRPFWKIYHSNTKAVKGKKFQENTEIENLDQSFDCLLDNLSAMMQYLDKYIVISIATSKTDAAPTQFIVENPLYVSNTTTNNNGVTAINGIGNMPVVQSGYSKQDVDKLVQERLDIYNALHKEQLNTLKKEMEYQRQLDDLRGEIAGISENQKTTVDKILGIAEHPVVSNLLTVILTKIMSPNDVQKVIDKQTEQQKQGLREEKSVSGNDELEEIDEDVLTEKIQSGLENLENVFPNESADVLMELGEIAKLNPDILKQLRLSMKQILNK
jgi:hypothetical protein